MKSLLSHLVILAVLTGLTSSATFGQGRRGGGPGTKGSDRLGSSGLDVGSLMPEVTVFDSEGKPFETASLKGKYSVIVFGCLT